MKNCRGRLMRMSSVDALLTATVGIIVMLPLCLGFAHEEQPPGKETGPVLRVLSVRKMTPEEYSRRVDDNIGAEYSVRLRLEASTNRGLYVFVPEYGQPFMCALERRGNKVRWLAAPRGMDETKSPGFDRLTARITPAWILLPPSGAYEWEIETHPTPPSTEEAWCIFVKGGKKKDPVELISTWYKTPSP